MSELGFLGLKEREELKISLETINHKALVAKEGERGIGN
jgi:hypothetical protein